MGEKDSKFGDYDGGHGSSFPPSPGAEEELTPAHGPGSDQAKTEAEVVTREEFERGAP